MKAFISETLMAGLDLVPLVDQIKDMRKQRGEYECLLCGIQFHDHLAFKYHLFEKHGTGVVSQNNKLNRREQPEINPKGKHRGKYDSGL